MQLNENFRFLEEVISLSEPLREWFLRNQQELLKYKMLHKNSTNYYKDKNCNYDIIVLEKMANSCFSWLESPKTLSISNLKKANYAALSIYGIYKHEYNNLSHLAKNSYYISMEKAEKVKKMSTLKK